MTRELEDGGHQDVPDEVFADAIARNWFSWYYPSQSLLEGAIVCWASYTDYRATKPKFGGARLGRAELRRVATFLVAAALEARWKAVLVARDPDIVQRTGAGFYTHNLLHLARAVRVPLDEKTTELLSRATGLIEFSARYPVRRWDKPKNRTMQDVRGNIEETDYADLLKLAEDAFALLYRVENAITKPIYDDLGGWV